MLQFCWRVFSLLPLLQSSVEWLHVHDMNGSIIQINNFQQRWLHVPGGPLTPCATYSDLGRWRRVGAEVSLQFDIHAKSFTHLDNIVPTAALLPVPCTTISRSKDLKKLLPKWSGGQIVQWVLHVCATVVPYKKL